MESLNKGADLSTANRTLQLTIEGRPYDWKRQSITGRELKLLANLPKESEIFLTISAPWKDEAIEDAEEVDLGRPGIEGFYMKKKLTFVLNGQQFETDRQYILGSQIRKLGKLSQDNEIFLSIEGPYEDELVKDGDRINLARQGIENFYSVEKPFEIIISVNGRDKIWKEKSISYDQVVMIAREGKPSNGAEKAYLVTYFDGPNQNPKGEMAKGISVFVTNNMMFNAAPTDKS
jgi:hypothetical protein